MLRDEMRELGLDSDSVEATEVGTGAEAAEHRFVGSPTIRVDGADVQAPGGEPAGLSCRVYRLRDGRTSALPDPADVREALRTALDGDLGRLRPRG
jgi:hypothetical protein